MEVLFVSIGMFEHVGQRNYATYFDTVALTELFTEAEALGLPLKLHAEQLSHLGGCQLAAEFGAFSADHVEYADEVDARAMAQSSTIQKENKCFFINREVGLGRYQVFTIC